MEIVIGLCTLETTIFYVWLGVCTHCQ